MFKNGMIVGLLIILGAVAVFTRNDNVVQQHQAAQITQLTARVDSLTASNAELANDKERQAAAAYLYVTALRMTEDRLHSGHAPSFAFFSRYIEQLRRDYPQYELSGALDEAKGVMTLWADDAHHDQLAKVECNLKVGSPITKHLEIER